MHFAGMFLMFSEIRKQSAKDKWVLPALKHYVSKSTIRILKVDFLTYCNQSQEHVSGPENSIFTLVQGIIIIAFAVL